VASIAIYDEVETLNYAGANFYATVLLLFSFVVLAGVYLYQGKKSQGVL
jgi:molybdate transport system permease protein